MAITKLSWITFTLLLVIITESKGQKNRNLYYERIRPAQFRVVIQTKPVAYVPVGTLEFHGEHLPLGTDGLEAQYFFEQVAKKQGGLIIPNLFLAPAFTSDPQARMHYTTSASTGSCYLISDSMFVEIMNNMVRLLAEVGFKIIVISGHAPSVIHSARQVARWEKLHKVKIITWRPYLNVTKGKANSSYEAHGSVNETSLVMYLTKGLVSMNALTARNDSVPFGVVKLNPRGIASKKYGKYLVEKHKTLLGDSITTILWQIHH